MNLLHCCSQDSFVLMAVFLLLIVMSFISWCVIFRKIFVIKLEHKSVKEFRLKYMNDPKKLISSLGQHRSDSIGDIISEVRNLQNLFHQINESERKEVLSTHLAQVLDLTKIKLDSGLTLLASVSSSAPFIGLFGTVWGIYGALLEISAKGSAGLSVVAAPMGEALIATAIGLFAAIPAAIFYNTFLRYNRLIIQDLRHICEQFSIYASQNSSNSNSKNGI